MATAHGDENTRTEFNTGIWANEEHQNFIRGLEMHGRGNWNAIGTFVRSRSQLQIRAHAQQHFAEDESVGLEQPATFVQGNHAGGAALSSSSSSPLPWGGGSGGASVVRLGVFDGATGSRSRSHSSSSSSSSSSRSSSNSNDSFRYCRFTWEPVSHLIANHTPAAHPEELHGDNNGTHIDPSLTVDVPGGVLPPVVDTDAHGGQHPQAFINLAGNQAGEPMVGLASHHNNGSGDYSPPVIWEQASLRGKTRRYVRIDDVCGIL